MLGKLFRWGFSLNSILIAMGLAACLGTGSLQSHAPAIDSDNTGTLESKDDPNPTDPISSLPGPFDPSSETSPADHPPMAEAEPSVFSTQIGEGHTPTRPLDDCAVEIFFSLEGIAADHDYPCQLPEQGSGDPAPRALLTSEDPGYEFLESFSGRCDLKGWELLIETEAVFQYSYETLLSIPRNFHLSVEILQEGVWVKVRDYDLSFSCPWPPPEGCISDCDPQAETTAPLAGEETSDTVF